MQLIRTVIALIALFGLLPLSAAQDAQSAQELCDAAEPADLTMMRFQEAEAVLEPDVDYRAIFCTTAGVIYVDLYESLTPMTVNNFVFLAQQAYYDNTTFHRVIPDFMVQGGDPTATGSGGPGYQFGDEPVGFLTFDRPGLLAMANAGPGTNGSQFFITTVPTPHLNYKHTIFGDVLVGQQNVETVRERDPGTATGPGETLQTVLIITDASQVDNSDVVALEPATQEQVIAAFEAFSSSMPPTLPVGEDSGLLSTAEVSEMLPSDVQDAFAVYVEDYGHQYRYQLDILNDDCDSSIFFSSLGYQVDVFENADAAAKALNDNFTRTLLQSEGFQHDEFTSATYRREATTCDGEAGVQALTLSTKGRILAALDVLVSAPAKKPRAATRGVRSEPSSHHHASPHIWRVLR